MILKKYLTEVAFQDGTSEFKSYRNYTQLIAISGDLNERSSISFELQRTEIDLETLTIEIRGKYDIPVYWKKMNGEVSNKIEAYLSAGSIFVEGDVIEINYVGLNEAISDLYSVDYETGVLYLAAETNIPLGVEYKFYNTLVKGKKATQLEDEDYQVTETEASIDNYRTDTNYKLVYNVLQTVKEEYTTPIIRNIKVNYINTSEEETF